MGTTAGVIYKEIRAEHELTQLELLLNQSFGVPEGESFYDDFPVWKSTANLIRVGAYENEKLLASASVRTAFVKAPLGLLKVALIGAVVTDEGWRGRGLASQLVLLCEQWAETQGCAFMVLWGSEHSLYQKLGFELCGSQVRIALKEIQFPEPAGIREIKVGWDPVIFEMIKKRPEGLALTDDDQTWFTAHKNVEWYYIGDKTAPLEEKAYFGYNRGIDLQNMVHEWGGNKEALLKLLSFLKTKQPELELLGHPEIFAHYGITCPPERTEFLGMIKVLNLKNVLAVFLSEEMIKSLQGFLQGGKYPEREITQILFGPAQVSGISSNALPLLFWIWGLDAA